MGDRCALWVFVNIVVGRLSTGLLHCQAVPLVLANVVVAWSSWLYASGSRLPIMLINIMESKVSASGDGNQVMLKNTTQLLSRRQAALYPMSEDKRRPGAMVNLIIYPIKIKNHIGPSIDQRLIFFHKTFRGYLLP